MTEERRNRRYTHLHHACRPVCAGAAGILIRWSKDRISQAQKPKHSCSWPNAGRVSPTHNGLIFPGCSDKKNS
jgi:hypothetical protein